MRLIAAIFSTVNLAMTKFYIKTGATIKANIVPLLIALTATPALHTTEIFGKPVFKYTYREAVIDGYLVDHAPPLCLKINLGVEGIHYTCGECHEV